MVYLLSALLFLSLFSSCEELPLEKRSASLYKIAGRDDGEAPYQREPIYQIRVPSSWQCRLPLKNTSLLDSRQPLAEFLIEEGRVTVAIHNFPSKNAKDHIPPLAQVARWKRQFERLDVAATLTQAESFGGFTGIMLEARGEIQKEKKAYLAWAMQLAKEHESSLLSLSNNRGAQLRGDYTIKAVGDPDLIDFYRDEIIETAHTFELIEEIKQVL